MARAMYAQDPGWASSDHPGVGPLGFIIIFFATTIVVARRSTSLSVLSVRIRGCVFNVDQKIIGGLNNLKFASARLMISLTISRGWDTLSSCPKCEADSILGFHRSDRGRLPIRRRAR
jgi:hypothetical protein